MYICVIQIIQIIKKIKHDNDDKITLSSKNILLITLNLELNTDDRQYIVVIHPLQTINHNVNKQLRIFSIQYDIYYSLVIIYKKLYLTARI